MEQIILEGVYRAFLCLLAVYLYRLYLRATARYGVIFEHCICSHGFENDEDCREYLTGERDGAFSVNNSE